MKKLQKILLTTDFSDAARGAYAPAAALARRFDARIHLVHSAESLPPHYFLHAQGIYTGIPKEPFLEEIEIRLRDKEAKHEAFEGVDVEPKLLYHSSPEEAVCHRHRRRDANQNEDGPCPEAPGGGLLLGRTGQGVSRE